MDQNAMLENQPTELDTLRARLAEAEETLRAIRNGEVDGLLIADGTGERVYTLRGADTPYRTLVEQIHEGAAMLNTNGDVIYCNRRFAELVNTPMQQVIGASIEQFVDSVDQLTVKTLIGDGVGKLRTRLRNNGGPVIDVHISVSTVTLDGVQHPTLIVTDMSALMQVQRESQSKDEFLAMLAHELRNPLGAIGSAVQVLSRADQREPYSGRARDIIRRQVEQMAHLVDDLLDVARVMTGKIVIEPQPVNLSESVQSCVTALSLSQQVAARVEVTAEPVWISADVVRLEQIVGNLVSNALKFSPNDRPVRISVTAEGSDAVLCVADEGIGIEPDFLPYIFDLFVQADRPTGHSNGGLGIGLTLVRKLVQLHGGSLQAASAGKDQGSMFIVRFPAMPASALSSAAPSQDRRSRRRVLLVDDNVDSREMYAILLQDEGHVVYQAGDGNGALAVFRDTTPDVAVVDIGLPDMDGYELGRRIRSEPNGTNVTLIALTGYGLPRDREQSRAAGFDQHLLKPISPDVLLRELDKFAPHHLKSR